MCGEDASDAVIARLAGAGHGVVARSELLRAGVTARQIEHRVTTGRLHPLRRGVYAVGHRVVSVEGRWRAATLSCGAGAVLSHATAAAVWELQPVGGGAIHVTVPGLGGRVRRRGIQVHRSATLTAADVTRHRAIPVTSVPRTIVDVARSIRGREYSG